MLISAIYRDAEGDILKENYKLEQIREVMKDIPENTVSISVEIRLNLQPLRARKEKEVAAS